MTTEGRCSERIIKIFPNCEQAKQHLRFVRFYHSISSRRNESRVIICAVYVELKITDCCLIHYILGCSRFDALVS